MSELEREMKEHLENHFKVKLSYTDTYDIFDYISECKTIYIELKGRKTAYNRYPTTMIGYNKILECEKNKNITYYFVFKFSDGLYYCKYSKKLLKKCEISIGGRCDRGRPEYKKYVFIPINLLKNIKI